MVNVVPSELFHRVSEVIEAVDGKSADLAVEAQNLADALDHPDGDDDGMVVVGVVGLHHFRAGIRVVGDLEIGHRTRVGCWDVVLGELDTVVDDCVDDQAT